MNKIETRTMTIQDRNGILLDLIVCVWKGKVIQYDAYRSSDMSPIDSKTLVDTKAA